MKHLLLGLSILFMSGIISAQPDSTARNNLPPIKLRKEYKTMWMGSYGAAGSMQAKDVKSYYYRVANGMEYKVDYLGANLAKKVKKVPEASALLRKYRNCKIAMPLLFVTGAVVGIAGLSAEMGKPSEIDDNGDEMPYEPNWTVPVIGLAIGLSSWIPHLMSKWLVEDAVTAYNKKAHKSS